MSKAKSAARMTKAELIQALQEKQTQLKLAHAKVDELEETLQKAKQMYGELLGHHRHTIKEPKFRLHAVQGRLSA